MERRVSRAVIDWGRDGVGGAAGAGSGTVAVEVVRFGALPEVVRGAAAEGEERSRRVCSGEMTEEAMSSSREVAASSLRRRVVSGLVLVLALPWLWLLLLMLLAMGLVPLAVL